MVLLELTAVTCTMPCCCYNPMPYLSVKAETTGLTAYGVRGCSVYGKMGLWEQAVKVLTLMKSEVSAPTFPPQTACYVGFSVLLFASG